MIFETPLDVFFHTSLIREIDVDFWQENIYRNKRVQVFENNFRSDLTEKVIDLGFIDSFAKGCFRLPTPNRRRTVSIVRKR